MLLLLYSSGLRMGELLRLKQSDIDQDRKVIYVRRATSQFSFLNFVRVTWTKLAKSLKSHSSFGFNL